MFLYSGWTTESSSREKIQVPVCANNASFCQSPNKITCAEFSCEYLSIDNKTVESGVYIICICKFYDHNSNTIDYNETKITAGTFVQIGCKNPGEDLDFGDNINRMNLECEEGR